MSEKKRFLLLLVLSMIASGAVFFALGLALASRFGFVENKVVVDTLSSDVASVTTTVLQERIDLNTATVEALMQIDGIGEKTAQNIIAYRESIGGFTFVEQLLYVDGIGETKYNKWAPYLTVATKTDAVSGTSSSTPTTTMVNEIGTSTSVITTDTTGVTTATQTTGTLTTTTTSTANGTTTTAKSTSTTVATKFQGAIDLNVATAEDLMQISGIGEKTAQNILAYRDHIGGFTCVEQLLDVDGIGEKKFNSWCAYFTVNGMGYSGTTSVTVTTVPTTVTTTAMSKRYHLNLVTQEELMTIRGIGEKIAASIIRYREELGGFTDMEQLMEIDGIGESRYATLCEYLTLEYE